MKDATANEAMNKGHWEGDARDNLKDAKEAISLEQKNRLVMDVDIVHAQMNEIYQETQTQPENITNWKKLGDLAIKIEDFDLAIQYYDHAYTNLTKKGDGALEKIISDTKVKKLTFTIREKEEQLPADPTNEALKQEIEDLKQQKETIILDECESRAKRYPNDVDIKFELAKIYFRNKQIDKAIPEFQRAAENPKNKTPCNNWLGMCFKEKGRLDMAIQRFKTAAEQAPIMNDLKKDILYNLGTTYQLMGKKTEGIEQFKIIYDVDVNYRDVAQKIDDFYKEQGNQAA
jgi:tetratricopeptide (TPR) repeat protein